MLALSIYGSTCVSVCLSVSENMRNKDNMTDYVSNCEGEGGVSHEPRTKQSTFVPSPPPPAAHAAATPPALSYLWLRACFSAWPALFFGSLPQQVDFHATQIHTHTHAHTDNVCACVFVYCCACFWESGTIFILRTPNVIKPALRSTEKGCPPPSAEMYCLRLAFSAIEGRPAASHTPTHTHSEA